MAKKEKVELSDMDLEEDIDLEEELGLLGIEEDVENMSKDDLKAKFLRLETEITQLNVNLDQTLSDLQAQKNYSAELMDKLSAEKEKKEKANILKFRVMSFIIDGYLENYIRVRANNDILRNATSLDLDDMERLNETISFNMGYKQSVMDLSKKLNLKIDFDE